MGHKFLPGKSRVLRSLGSLLLAGTALPKRGRFQDPPVKGCGEKSSDPADPTDESPPMLSGLLGCVTGKGEGILGSSKV